MTELRIDTSAFTAAGWPKTLWSGAMSTTIFRVLLWLVLVAFLAPFSSAQSLAGIRIGAPATTLDHLNLQSVARSKMGTKESVKYTLANGNELSATHEAPSGRIVYVECDWSRKPDSSRTDFADFKFGTTTLERIRAANGSNGFSWKSNAFGRNGDELFTFNAYRVEENPGLVVVFVTSLNIAEFRNRTGRSEPTANEIAKFLTLDGLILADEAYLDEIWGKEKVFDKEMKPVAWPATTESH